MKIKIEAFFDRPTYTLTYLVADQDTGHALIIDPVWNYDQASGNLTTTSFDQLHQVLQENSFELKAVLETHAHADHLSSSALWKKKFPQVKTVIGKGICEVQSVFTKIFNRTDISCDGSQFDMLLKDGETVQFGSIPVKVISTPGHTPACCSFLIGEHVFTGDALFMPDFGTGRCDFPKGSAQDLYHSVHQKLYRLPDSTKVYVGHDYQPGGRALQYQSTIGEEKEKNIQLKAHTSQEEFVRFRTDRDATLSAPVLLLPSIQVNITAGHLPPAEKNGTRYLKLPLKGEILC